MPSTNAKKEEVRQGEVYSYHGSDSIARLGSAVGAFVTGIVFALLLLAGKLGWRDALCILIIELGIFIIGLGFRFSIVVRSDRVTITKRWYIVPYYRGTAPCIEDVWFGGDWGEPEGAISIVVVLKGKEFDIGSARSMHQLYDELSPSVVSRETLEPSTKGA